MTNKIEQILSVIREACDLESKPTYGDVCKSSGLQAVTWSKEQDVELTHLLLAMNKRAGAEEYMAGSSGVYERKCGDEIGLIADYDLTKSLLANLEDNPELVDFLINLFNLN